MSSVVDWCHEKQEEEDYQHKVNQVKNRLHIQEPTSSVSAASDPQWSPEIPTEPGFYWFHGTYRHEREEYRHINGQGYQYIPRSNPTAPSTRVIRVVKSDRPDIASKPALAYITESGCIDYVVSGLEGQWLKIDPPTPPKNLEKDLDRTGQQG